MSKLIYLASPYSKYPLGRDKACAHVAWKAAELMLQGHCVFAPIPHSHTIEELGMVDVQDGDFWLKQDFAVLKHCDELWIYKMPGWDVSEGVLRETYFAADLNIPIKYLEYEVEDVV